MKVEDFQDVDKRVSDQIAIELADKIIEHICPDCSGKGCKHCDKSGVITIQY